jgi:predicted sulfurtransferase
MNDARNIAIDAINNLEYRIGNFDDVLRFLDTDMLVDMALYIIRMYDDNAEIESNELEQLNNYAKEHGIED